MLWEWSIANSAVVIGGEGIKLYFDNSVLNRPFDDQRQGTVWIETLSFSLAFSLVELGEAEMIRSALHDTENAVSPDSQRREYVESCLSYAKTNAPLSDSVLERARELVSSGLKPMDALHVSAAEMAGATHFLTSDAKLIRRYRGKMRVVSPLTFVAQLGTHEDDR